MKKYIRRFVSADRSPPLAKDEGIRKQGAGPDYQWEHGAPRSQFWAVQRAGTLPREHVCVRSRMVQFCGEVVCAMWRKVSSLSSDGIFNSVHVFVRGFNTMRTRSLCQQWMLRFWIRCLLFGRSKENETTKAVSRVHWLRALPSDAFLPWECCWNHGLASTHDRFAPGWLG